MTDAPAYTELERNGQTNPVELPEDLDGMDTAQLLVLYKQTGDEQLKWTIVLRYEGLIKNVAQQIRGVYSSFTQVEDVVNEGILTLLSAIDKFDLEKGVKFETYIAKRIRGMIIDLARKQDWLPRNIRRRAREIDEAVTELSSNLGRFPTEVEIAAHLGITQERYNKDMASVALSNVLSLDALMDLRETDGAQFEVPSRDPQGQPETVLQEQELQQILTEGIQSLRENEQIVLSLYYEKNLHMKEIAQVMQVSEPRISQIHAAAIQKLRTYMQNYMTGAQASINPKKRKKE